MHRIDGAGATVDHTFTEGDPIGGVQATVVTAPWLNDIQEELMSILGAGGVAPVKGTQDQVLKALTGLIRAQSLTAVTTAGTAPAFTLAPSPAIDAYAANQRFRVKFSAAAVNGTLNVSGKGPKNLKQYDSSGNKVGTIVASGQLADVEYDGTDMIVRDPLPASPPLPYNFFSGFEIANNASAPTTTIDVAPGAARDSADAVNIKLTTTIRGILQASGAWTAGDNQNKLDTGARANNTWYHKFAIRKTSDGTGDILFSLSPTAPTLPSGYAGFVLIESIRTDGAGSILPFVNVGRSMTWKTARQDVNLTSVAAANTTVTCSTPPGRRVMAKQYAAVAGNAATVYTHAPDVNNETLAFVGGGWKAGISTNNAGVSDEPIAGYLECVTGVSSDIVMQTYTAAGTLVAVQLSTMGWEKI